ncbi:hypothetical protein HDV00_003657 [Rhizophlyctis rosea]|nr:hypothetical protein HDV00_003657 [Rhizophlyctis rosea]
MGDVDIPPRPRKRPREAVAAQITSLEDLNRHILGVEGDESEDDAKQEPYLDKLYKLRNRRVISSRTFLEAKDAHYKAFSDLKWEDIRRFFDVPDQPSKLNEIQLKFAEPPKFLALKIAAGLEQKTGAYGHMELAPNEDTKVKFIDNVR